MNLTLTEGQQKALDVIHRIMDRNALDVGIISGYAGTGKTTLLKVLAEELGDNLTVVTPTGKAAMRVREVAPVNAMTIHRWLYVPKEDENGDIHFRLRPDVAPPPHGIIIIDEASMVSREVWSDLRDTCWSQGTSIIAIGDGFQLPPVTDDNDSFSLFDPNFTAPNFSETFKVNMTEVVRQALDNPIIRISMEVRKTPDFSTVLMGLPAVSEKKLIEHGLRTWERGGAVICHRNKTRHRVNREIRQARGLHGLSTNEPLLVLKNNYNLDRFNGEVVTLSRIGETIAESSTIKFKGQSFGMKLLEVMVDDVMPALIGEEQVLGLADEIGTKAIESAARRAAWAYYPDESDGPPYLHANFGYTLTAHKSQGSEFPSVLVVIEPSIRLFTPQGRRWLYTALTRTRGECTLCWLT